MKKLAIESKCECEKNISNFLQNLVNFCFPFVRISQKMVRQIDFWYLFQNYNVVFSTKIMWLRGFIIK